jgi:hypothetical protein
MGTYTFRGLHAGVQWDSRREIWSDRQFILFEMVFGLWCELRGDQFSTTFPFSCSMCATLVNQIRLFLIQEKSAKENDAVLFWPLMQRAIDFFDKMQHYRQKPLLTYMIGESFNNSAYSIIYFLHAISLYSM